MPVPPLPIATGRASAAVEHPEAASERLAQAGRAFEMAPAVEIAVRKLLAAPASGTTSVELAFGT